jgi:hypothetical protein
LSEDPASSLAELEGEGVAGLTLYKLSKLNAFSPDRPGGVNNPLPFPHLKGWLHVGGLGVSGVIEVVESRDEQELGEPARPNYVGVLPFKTTLFPDWKRVVLMRVIDSAVHDSRIDGFFTIGGPCKIDQLDFTDMKLTSTASLVGGKVSLPPAGVKLDYWQLSLVPTGDKAEAGVVSIRTGRLFFMAAGINEPVHFDKRFNLIWGELLADGNVGEFIFDHNCLGQRFDKFSFTPHRDRALALVRSDWSAGSTRRVVFRTPFRCRIRPQFQNHRKPLPTGQRSSPEHGGNRGGVALPWR